MSTWIQAEEGPSKRNNTASVRTKKHKAVFYGTHAPACFTSDRSPLTFNHPQQLFSGKKPMNQQNQQEKLTESKIDNLWG